MTSLFGRGFNPLHLHYVTMKGLEPFIVYFLPPPSPQTKKAQLERLSLFLWRCVPDSNGCTRFCRPLTKPLIQRTMWGLVPNCGCKGSGFFRLYKIKWGIFLQSCVFLPNFVTDYERSIGKSQEFHQGAPSFE